MSDDGGMTLEQAAAMGFRREDAEPCLRVLEAVAAPEGTFDVAMDLARYAAIPLRDATEALALATVDNGRRLRRFGLDPATVASEVAGMAAAYSKTYWGSREVAAAQGKPIILPPWLQQLADRMFGSHEKADGPPR